MSDNPILNSPYDEPRFHYATNDDEQQSINYARVNERRRLFDPSGQPSGGGLGKFVFRVELL